MSRKKIPQDYHVLAEKRHFEWLGPEARNTDTKTTWKCTKGHKWQSDYGHIKQGRGCPYCSNRAPKTCEDYHDLAKTRGFERIGTIIIDQLTEATGENPLTFTDRIGAARGPVEVLEGIQLSFKLKGE